MLDRRVKYTRHALRQSLLTLMKEKAIGKIAVKELCVLADVNRSTFYAHYASPADLLDQIQNELFDEIQRSLEERMSAATIPDLLADVFQTIRKNGDLCKILFSEYGDKEFLRRIVDIAREPCMREWASAGGMLYETRELLYAFLANGIVGVVRVWVDGGMTIEPAEMAQFILRFSSSTILAVSGD